MTGLWNTTQSNLTIQFDKIGTTVTLSIPFWSPVANQDKAGFLVSSNANWDPAIYPSTIYEPGSPGRTLDYINLVYDGGYTPLLFPLADYGVTFHTGGIFNLFIFSMATASGDFSGSGKFATQTTAFTYATDS